MAFLPRMRPLGGTAFQQIGGPAGDNSGVRDVRHFQRSATRLHRCPQLHGMVLVAASGQNNVGLD